MEDQIAVDTRVVKTTYAKDGEALVAKGRVIDVMGPACRVAWNGHGNHIHETVEWVRNLEEAP